MRNGAISRAVWKFLNPALLLAIVERAGVAAAAVRNGAISAH
ncbi:hypothetical protein HMPREF0294_2184 [Corynebacterium glucuronolyticum ATCC 51867]|nr:hypothetical protein HMPREF0294_2184 [Corynebacterium glucuronolyticum ATCC 51867]